MSIDTCTILTYLNHVNINELDFNVLGYGVKFHPSTEGDIDPKEVVKRVNDEIKRQYGEAGSSDPAEVAILVALKLSSQLVGLEERYKEDITKMKEQAEDIFHLIKDISPGKSLS